MAVASSNASAPDKTQGQKRESFKTAVLQIVVVGAILAAGVAAVYFRGHRQREVRDGILEARSLAQRGNPADLNKALEKTQAVLKLSDTPDAHALAADLETELWVTHRVPGADARARDDLARAEAGDSRSEDRYGSKALLLVADGKAKEAETYIEELRKQGANSAKLWYAQARAYQAEGNLPLAKQAFAQALNKAWREPRYAAAYGEALIDEGQYAAALDTLNKGLSSNPDNLRVRLDVALARLFKRDGVKDASDTLTEILGREAELTPGLKARALAGQAHLALFEQKPDHAIALADQAVAQNPDEHYALFAKARALGAKKDPSAYDAFATAIAKRKTAPGLYLEGATLLSQNGNHASALKLLDGYEESFRNVTLATSDGKAVPALDRDDRYWIARGDVLKSASKYDEAMAAYDKAIAADSVNLVRAHYAKGALYLARNEYDKAAEVLGPITPPDGTGHVGEAYQAMGETLFAKKDFANGCQQFAFAITRLRSQQAPRERLNAIVDEVSKKLVAAGQKPMAQLWVKEAKPLIQ